MCPPWRVQQLHDQFHVFQMILHLVFMEFAAVLMNFSAVESTAWVMQLNTSCIRCPSLTTSSTIIRGLQTNLLSTCMMLWTVKVDATGSNVLETCRSLTNVQKIFSCGAFRKLWTVAVIFRCLAMYVQFQLAGMLTSSWIQVQMWLWYPCSCQMLDVRRHKTQKHTSESDGDGGTPEGHARAYIRPLGSAHCPTPATQKWRRPRTPEGHRKDARAYIRPLGSAHWVSEWVRVSKWVSEEEDGEEDGRRRKRRGDRTKNKNPTRDRLCVQ